MMKPLSTRRSVQEMLADARGRQILRRKREAAVFAEVEEIFGKLPLSFLDHWISVGAELYGKRLSSDSSDEDIEQSINTVACLARKRFLDPQWTTEEAANYIRTKLRKSGTA